jgi:putative DNA-invertase from lambdoid prophage Rac
MAAARGLDIAHIFEEKVSAAKERPEYDRMMLAAHRGEFSVLAIWALDRLQRSMTGAVHAVLDLDRLGVEVLSVREPWLDTGGPVRGLCIAIFGWMGEQERLRVSERVRCAQDRARAEGRLIGRPRAQVDLDAALRLRSEGLSIRVAARKLEVGASTLHRVYQAHDALLRATSPLVPKTSALGPNSTPMNIIDLQDRIDARSAVPEGEPLGHSDTRTGT